MSHIALESLLPPPLEPSPVCGKSLPPLCGVVAGVLAALVGVPADVVIVASGVVAPPPAPGVPVPSSAAGVPVPSPVAPPGDACMMLPSVIKVSNTATPTTAPILSPFMHFLLLTCSVRCAETRPTI
jgi:hypothetical protein